MTDIWAQLQLLVDQYWEQAVAIVFVAGVLIVYSLRRRARKPAAASLAASDVAPSAASESGILIRDRIVVSGPVEILIRRQIPTKGAYTEEELQRAVPPPLPTVLPTPPPTAAQVVKAHDPTTRAEKDITREALKLLGFGGGKE